MKFDKLFDKIMNENYGATQEYGYGTYRDYSGRPISPRSNKDEPKISAPVKKEEEKYLSIDELNYYYGLPLSENSKFKHYKDMNKEEFNDYARRFANSFNPEFLDYKSHNNFEVVNINYAPNSIDIKDNIDLSFGGAAANYGWSYKGMPLKELPIKFNKVNGDFNCSYNDLQSTEAIPNKENVTGNYRVK